MKILAVDDDPIALEMIRSALNRFGHEVITTTSGAAALERLSQFPIRMVITDWMMDFMDGIALCRAIRQRKLSRYVYVIILSSRDDPVDAAEGIAAGADDFMAKPFDTGELVARIKAGERALSLETRDVTIFALARLAESRDQETGLHLERTRNYVKIIAQQLSQRPKLASTIHADFVQMLYDTSPLHDIGKVAIPDAILLKPGKLTDDEYEIMKRHSAIGANTLEEVLQSYPGAEFLEMARDIAATHHERFDGRGYPKGLAGEQIPWAGRIMALADVYDAITSRRVYKAAESHEHACNVIHNERGKQFDPRVTDAFFDRESEILEVQMHYHEAEEARRKSINTRQDAWNW